MASIIQIKRSGTQVTPSSLALGELAYSYYDSINGEYVDRPNLWNFFDTLHDPVTKTYMGEDFAFCKRWKDIGGKCYAYVNDTIIHVGEHQYEGCFADELKPAK